MSLSLCKIKKCQLKDVKKMVNCLYILFYFRLTIIWTASQTLLPVPTHMWLIVGWFFFFLYRFVCVCVWGKALVHHNNSNIWIWIQVQVVTWCLTCVHDQWAAHTHTHTWQQHHVCFFLSLCLVEFMELPPGVQTPVISQVISQFTTLLYHLQIEMGNMRPYAAIAYWVFKEIW